MMEKKCIPTLTPEDIEVKVKQVGQKGAVALLYKTSRVDMRILDEVYGVNNWQSDYQMIGDMLFCTISIWDDDKQQWIRKQSNGIESREDSEGNEAKGWASDSMKRAGFMLGIGRELYSAPFTFLNVETVKDERTNKYKLKDEYARFCVTDIGYDEKRKINRLVIANVKTGEVVYKYGNSNPNNGDKTPDKQEKQTPPKTTQKPPKTAPKPQNATVEKSDTLPQAEVPPHQQLFNNFLTRHKLTGDQFIALRARAVKGGRPVTQKSLKELTPDEWVELLAMLEAYYEEGFFKD